MGKALAVFASMYLAIALVVTQFYRPYTTPPHLPAPEISPSAAPTTAAPIEPDLVDPDRSGVPVPHVKPEGFVDPPAGSGIDRYYNQPANWSSCGDEPAYQCLKISAPLDWNKPDGQAITLALRKRPARAEPRQGAIFANPGGPGEAGQSMARRIDAKGLENFDIIGFDPRGTGESTRVQCPDAAAQDAMNKLDASPDDEAEWDALVAGVRKFQQGCLERSGSLLEHVATSDAAKDLEMFRRVTKSEQLNYLGYSYGGQLGAQYVQLFQSYAGKLVFDGVPLMPRGAVQPKFREGAAYADRYGFGDAFKEFAKWCVEKSCELGKTSDEVVAATVKFLDAMDVKPMPVGSRTLTQSLAVYGILDSLYSDQRWPDLKDGLEEAIAGEGGILLRLSDYWTDRSSDGTYQPGVMARAAIRCLEDADRGVDDVKKRAAAAAKTDSVFGKYLAVDVTCEVWPVKAQPPANIKELEPKLPILAIGGKHDPATPYADAEEFVRRVSPTAVLLTWEGQGHTAFGKSPCVNEHVVAYFTKGTLPPKGTSCAS